MREMEDRSKIKKKRRDYNGRLLAYSEESMDSFALLVL